MSVLEIIILSLVSLVIGYMFYRLYFSKKGSGGCHSSGCGCGEGDKADKGCGCPHDDNVQH